MVEARRSALQIRWHRACDGMDRAAGANELGGGALVVEPYGEVRKPVAAVASSLQIGQSRCSFKEALARQWPRGMGIAAQTHNIVDSSATQQLGIASHSTSQHLAACLHGVSPPAANRQQPPAWSPGRNHARQQLGKSARLAVQASS
uniref:Uncharacterized protein n=1 Tax=Oryza rufipogon TaxID=4529 RepID=A0A0E0RIF5_ORYRU